MNQTIHRIKLCAAAALLAAGSATAFAQSAPAPADGARKPATPAGMPPGSTSTKGDKAAAPTGSGMATDPNTGSTPGMPPGTTADSADKSMTPKGKGTTHGKHMKHGDSAASGAGMSNTP